MLREKSLSKSKSGCYVGLCTKSLLFGKCKLGIYIVNAQKFKCNFDRKRQNIIELPMLFLGNLVKPITRV